METRTIRNTKRKHRGYQHNIREKRQKGEYHQSFRISDLNCQGYYKLDPKEETEMKGFVILLYESLLTVYPDLKEIQCFNASVGAVLFAIKEFLDSKFNLYDIDFVTEDGKPSIQIFKYYQYPELKIFNLQVEGVLKVKKHNKRLYDILIGYLKNFSINGVLKDTHFYSYALWYLEEKIQTQDYEDDEEGKLLTELQREYEDFEWATRTLPDEFNWKEELEKYHPRKEIYQLIKSFLLEHPKVDFSILEQLPKDTLGEEQEYETLGYFEEGSPVYPEDTLMISISQNDFVVNEYVWLVTQQSNEYGSKCPLDVMTINTEGQVNNFKTNQNQIDTIIDLVYDFNDFFTTVYTILK